MPPCATQPRIDCGAGSPLGGTPREKISTACAVADCGRCNRLNEEQYLESDADEQLILTIPFSCAVKIKSITVVGSAAETGSNPAEMRAFINRDDVDFDVGSTPSNLTRTRTSHTCATQHVLLPPARYHSPAVLAPSDVAQHGPVAAAGRCQG
eukprot:COSAG01_NODE_4377_length_5085_cov_6.039110_4_plen_153_part_00